ncbi:DUF4926 domain-containing protein [Oscillatoria sp. CS-180]|uniref:DUF4926 domain-containing protein n=1 Tax=Oscillatoria sp. CS-180 TaxID=3021720 RepID=UPI00232B088B|nr:DUF4926 domain-containing protein [Oscillatoria sp. CS-180]MDB9525304.1 DUF4926 domain-containing protein [Oscillatoria sp. CS-180]
MTIHEYDVVALTEDLEALHPDTQSSILLRRGQVGTVLMKFNGEACLVDFSDNDGQSYAMETISVQKLMPLFHEPAVTAA